MKLDLAIDEIFPQPIEAVWAALTDRATLASWLMPNDFEPRVGHRFTLDDPAVDCHVTCQVLELDPPRRMVWSWHAGAEGETVTRVTFELAAAPGGAGGTRLVMRHEGDTTPAQRDSVGAGWAQKLPALRRWLEVRGG